MTFIQFIVACQERTVDPGLAQENEAVRVALKNREDGQVLQLLDEEF